MGRRADPEGTQRVDDDREWIDLRECLKDGGSVCTGTNAEDTNVSGKIAMKPIELADSAEGATRPTSAKTHEKP